MSDIDLEDFLALYLGKPSVPQPLTITVTRRPERTQDSLRYLLARAGSHFRKAQQEANHDHRQ